MDTTARETLYRRLATTFIAVVLFAQAATIPFTAARKGDLLWLRLYPILEYDMYREKHQEGDRVQASYIIEAVFGDGQILPVTQEMLNLYVWDFIALVDGVVVYKREDKTRQLIDLVRKRIRGSERIVELKIKSLGLRVTRTGPEKIDPALLMTVPVPASAGAAEAGQ